METTQASQQMADFGITEFFWMALQPLWALASLQFPDLFTISRTPWTSDQLVAMPLP
jgi:hypothetical protein